MAHDRVPEALRRVAYRFAAAVPAAATVLLEQPVSADGTVEVVRVRIYAGAGLDLEVRPYVVDARGVRRDLVTYPAGGKQFVDGDDDVFAWALREPVYVERRDVLSVEFTNRDAVNAYDGSCDIEVDYAGGAWPIWVVQSHG